MFQLYELSAAREVGVKPVKGCVGYTNGGKSMEEGGVGYGVEGCTKVEEDENG